jgi:FkbM family methyltransferase
MKEIFRKILNKFIGINTQKVILLKLARFFGIDLLMLSLNNNGILNYKNENESGEKYFINTFLTDRLSRKTNPVLFDVGANIGKYTESLFKSFPHAKIYAFEPNPNSFALVQKNLNKLSTDNIQLFSLGLSSSEEPKIMTSYENNTSSSHTSLHSEVFTEFHHSHNNVQITARFTTLDSFCEQQKINHIDLLKIDTEGHELEVLRGAKEMILSKKIDCIQFEFGECHVYSRVFLRDFYNALPNYTMFRLLPKHLKPLGEHSPHHEIFRFQNIIALKND